MTLSASHPETPTPSPFRIWWTAIRPATLTAAFGPVVVGSALADAHARFRLGPALAALLGAIFIQIGTNLFNDYADFIKGADTDERLGPDRATQKGWLTPRQVAAGSAWAFGAATLFGIYLVSIAGWPIVAIGLLSIAAGVLYTGGPWPLAYIGMGDLFVLIFFGVVAVCGTYYVQALHMTPDVLLASVAVGLFATAILVVNNLRDRHTDVLAGKKTLVVRWGATFARWEFTLLIGGGYLLIIMVFLFTRASLGWLLPLLSLPLAWHEVRSVWNKDGAELNKHLGGTARLGLVFSALLGLGVIL